MAALCPLSGQQSVNSRKGQAVADTRVPTGVTLKTLDSPQIMQLAGLVAWSGWAIRHR